MATYKHEKAFCNRIKYDKNSEIPNMHFHSKHELYYLVSGTTTYFINNEIFFLNPGDFVFVPKGSFHRTDYAETETVERILFCFDDALVGDDCQKHIEILTKKKFISILGEHHSKIEDIIAKIEAEKEHPTANSPTIEKLYFKLLLVLITQYRDKSNNPSDSENYNLVQNVVSYISLNCSWDLSLDFLSEEFGISPNYLCTIFKKTTGIGISEYINITRSNMAQLLLETTAMSITDIATKCGFNSSSYFTQVFKKHYGVTPKRYATNFKKQLTNI